MDKILNIYKPVGITPVQLIELLRKLKPEYKDIKIGFAGRLDPLAHGVMLLTVGEKNKERAQYLNLSKTYRFKALFGVETDSYDYLGLIQNSKTKDPEENVEKRIKNFIKRHLGKISQPYPPFSSKTINGIQLFKLAKANKLDIADLPVREVEIFKFELSSIKNVSVVEIKKEIIKNLKKIRGHFRQARIIKQWESFFKENEKEFMMAEFEIECSSGTYVRSLVHNLGQELACGAIAFEIFRTKVGEFKISESLKLS